MLLQAGAATVYAVDVGHGQLAGKVAADPRVVNLERTHAADLDRSLVPEPIGLIVCDVSFISIKKALPPVFALAAGSAQAVILVKPQFEVGRDRIGKGGLVRMHAEELRGFCEAEVSPWFEENGWVVDGLIESPIQGGDGNTEFLLAAHRG